MVPVAIALLSRIVVVSSSDAQPQVQHRLGAQRRETQIEEK